MQSLDSLERQLAPVDSGAESAGQTSWRAELRSVVQETIAQQGAELCRILRADLRDLLLHSPAKSSGAGVHPPGSRDGAHGETTSGEGSPARVPRPPMAQNESLGSGSSQRRRCPECSTRRCLTGSRVRDEVWHVFAGADEDPEVRPMASSMTSQRSACSAASCAGQRRQHHPREGLDVPQGRAISHKGKDEDILLDIRTHAIMPHQVPSPCSRKSDDRSEGISSLADLPEEAPGSPSSPMTPDVWGRRSRRSVSQFMATWKDRKGDQSAFLEVSGSSIEVQLADGSPRRRSRCRTIVERCVRHPRFDWLFCSLIVLNACTFGAQADYIARRQPLHMPPAFTIVEAFFCIAFTVELILRMAVRRCGFFRNGGWAWNVFDVVMVISQQLEVFVSMVWPESSDALPSNLSAARLLRVLRLVRVVRLIRFLRLVRDLRLLVSSILSSMRSLGWTVLLLVVLIYCVSLGITQLVSDHRIAAEDTPELEALIKYYGSLGRSMLSLFEAVTGGVDWDDLVSPLIAEISPWLALAFAIYIAFCTLAMMNVVTGVFVESVLLSARTDKDYYLVANAREIFKTVDGGVNGEMTLDDFMHKVHTPEMREFFKGIDVDPSEAKSLFSLIDLDESGAIDAEEFLRACVRLRGPAMALDAAVLVQRIQQVANDLEEQRQFMESVLVTKGGVQTEVA
mmetsp:Transcript_109245/g.315673  ORF Transcript_109245/g.315673 Transcript_109245/m.315673 type:complete len:683 (-) Transcript_109245:464-2512(-)